MRQTPTSLGSSGSQATVNTALKQQQKCYSSKSNNNINNHVLPHKWLILAKLTMKGLESDRI